MNKNQKAVTNFIVLKRILDNSPEAKRIFVDAMIRNFIYNTLYPSLMAVQTNLNIQIPPEMMMQSIVDVMNEEMKDGPFKRASQPPSYIVFICPQNIKKR